MAWAKLRYTKGQIDRAGNNLIAVGKDDPRRNQAIEVVDNWRMCHAYPLQVIKMTLLRRAKSISTKSLVAQRLKRRPSIEIKLRDNLHMKLSQMQDIGGCRAIMPTVRDVRSLVAKYKKGHAKSPKKTRSMWDGSEDFDYIARPKADGYRSVHLIFRFQSPSQERGCYNGQRIEIQIRSKLQHLWATAVETAQVFTGQALKSKVKNANEDWLRFFALASGAFALREKCPLVPDVPENKDEIVQELKALSMRQNIMPILWGWSNAIQFWGQKQIHDAQLFLLVLDPTGRKLITTPFRNEEILEAQQAYEQQEKETEGSPDMHVVLVSVDSVDALRKAYPNYYADTADFIAEVVKETGKDILPATKPQKGNQVEKG